MPQGLHFHPYYHPPLQRITGEHSLRAAGTLFIAVVLLALLYFGLDFLTHSNF
jgi:hypothetical protein